MALDKISIPHSRLKPPTDIHNTNYIDKCPQLVNMILHCCHIWNDIAYAWSKIQEKVGRYDPKFYYQAIIFNLYMLGAITKRIENDILNNNDSLKDLRDNIAHMDERLKEQLNFVPLNSIKAGAVLTNTGGGKTFVYSLNGLNMNMSNDTVSSPLGVVDNTVFSSLKPSRNSKYVDFVSYDITEDHLNEVKEDLIELLGKYFIKIEFTAY
jgi:hypothetical protein